MPEALTKPIEDTVPKLDDRIAVGEDLKFQRRWWRFERGIWIFFILILIADILGGFGRGWLAKAQLSDPSQSLTVDYERIARASTPSMITLRFGPNAIHDGKVTVFVSDSVVKQLGAQRIAPQPITSTIGNGGITYTFPATVAPAMVQIELSPSFPGAQHFRVQSDGGQPLHADVFVMP